MNLSRNQTIVFYLLLAVGVFLWRSLYSSHPELGGDAYHKWASAVVIGVTGDFNEILERWHHSLRWAAVLPTAVIVKLVGPTLDAYYLSPLLFFTGLFLLLFYFARESMRPPMVLVFITLFFFDPYFYRASSQHMPYVFGVFFIVCSLWILYLDRERSSRLMLVLASLAAFFAYGAKETYIFFYPGLALFILLQFNLRRAIAFSLLILAWFVVETLVINWMSGETRLGRIEILLESEHVDQMDREYADITYLEMVVTRWIRLPTVNLALCSLAGLYAAWVLLTGRLRRLHPAVQGMLLTGVSYAAIVSLVPLKLDPLTAIQPLKPKYIIPLLPFVAFLVAALLDQLYRCIRRWRRPADHLVVTATLLFLLFTLFFESPVTTSHRTNVYPQKLAMLWRHADIAAAVDAGYAVCVRERFEAKQTEEMLIRFGNYPAPPKKWKINLNTDRSRIPRAAGGEYRIVHYEKYAPEEAVGYIRARGYRFLDHIDQCDQWGTPYPG